MSTGHSFTRRIRAAFLGGMAIVAGSIAGCGGDGGGGEPPGDWTPFVQLALQQSTCSDIRNRLFVIDQAVVRIDHAGNCPDGSYSQVLYGDTVNDILCEHHDSFAGPMKNCRVPEYAEMFEIIITHLTEPDLGLGSGHEVRQLRLR
jgi:hypothetical protein